MLKSSLTTFNAAKQSFGISSEKQPEEYLANSIEDLTNIIKRRTANGKTFGKLEITAPNNEEASSTCDPETIHYLASFLLDISTSMRGEKILHAKNTIINLLEVLLAEKKGKTTPTRKIHTWFCLITFNDRSRIDVPFQELSDESFKSITETIQRISVSGSTSYEEAFKCQSIYLRDIMQSADSFSTAATTTAPTTTTTTTADRMPKQVHIVKFFETDGDITCGTTNLDILYPAMREQPTPHAAYKYTLFTYEDIVIGYGVDVDTKCLKTLASPQPPHNPHNQHQHHNCSSFISIAKPEDIGWQVGELLFKLLTRFGAPVKVSVEAAQSSSSSSTSSTAIELFEYQTHTWSNTTTLHSIALNETKTIFVQIENGVVEFTSAIEVTDQITGQTTKYKFNHEIPAAAAAVQATEAEAEAAEEVIADADMLSMILGMIQLEIFKAMREIEADNSIYDMDLLVSEVYKMMRILKHINDGKIFRLQESQDDEEHQPYAMTPQLMWLENLITDAKVLIGLTTIGTKNDQLAIIHARRTSSAEHDFFSTGQNAIKAYIEGEENQEQEAKAALLAVEKKQKDGNRDGDGDGNGDGEEDAYQQEEPELDCIPSRVATTRQIYTCNAIDTPFAAGRQSYNHNQGGHRPQTQTTSNLRTLCARIAIAKENKDEDYNVEEIVRQIRYGRVGIDYYQRNRTAGGGQYEETFSSIPDDEYSSRRVQMMRQMSTPSSAQQLDDY